jgi:hypothetical protein
MLQHQALATASKGAKAQTVDGQHQQQTNAKGDVHDPLIALQCIIFEFPIKFGSVAKLLVAKKVCCRRRIVSARFVK